MGAGPGEAGVEGAEVRRGPGLALALAAVLLGARLGAETPARLDRYLLGENRDAEVARRGGLLLVGGGDPPTESLQWMIERASKGDFVVIGASGGRGFDEELRAAGGPRSVRSFVLNSREASWDSPLLRAVRNAEGIYFEGGDQARYLRFIRDTPLQAALQAAHESGAVLGGSSAGLAILGQYVFGALRDTVHSPDALNDPLGERVVVEPALLDLRPLRGVLTDTHFANRDRMGRLLAFLGAVEANWHPDAPRAIAVDEDTAVAVEPAGRCRLFGPGRAYFVALPRRPETFAKGVPLSVRDVLVERLDRSGSFHLRTWRGTGTARYRLEAEKGRLRSSQAGGRVY